MLPLTKFDRLIGISGHSCKNIIMCFLLDFDQLSDKIIELSAIIVLLSKLPDVVLCRLDVVKNRWLVQIIGLQDKIILS